jgi:hypothetical protein
MAIELVLDFPDVTREQYESARDPRGGAAARNLVHIAEPRC